MLAGCGLEHKDTVVTRDRIPNINGVNELLSEHWYPRSDASRSLSSPRAKRLGDLQAAAWDAEARLMMVSCLRLTGTIRKSATSHPDIRMKTHTWEFVYHSNNFQSDLVVLIDNGGVAGVGIVDNYFSKISDSFHMSTWSKDIMSIDADNDHRVLSDANKTLLVVPVRLTHLFM